jgi:poly-beta-1,6-N-acetyl-D-glucosamine synthase
MTKKSGLKIPGSLILVIGLTVSNFINFVFNLILGRTLTLQQFGVISLLTTLWYLISVVSNGLTGTTNYEVSYNIGGGKEDLGDHFYKNLRKKAPFISFFASIVLLLASPFIANYFKVSDPLILAALFSVISFEMFNTVTRGYLQGKLKLLSLAILINLEALSKIIFACIFLLLHQNSLVYYSIPLSIVFATVAAYFISLRILPKIKMDEKSVFPGKYFIASLLSTLSTTIFLSVDLILAKHYLSPANAGAYALLSLMGKIVYFVGSVFGGLITSFVARDVGANRNSVLRFYIFLFTATVLSFVAFIFIGPLGRITASILLGNKSQVIFPYLTEYGAAILMFTIMGTVLAYHLVKKQFLITLVPLFSCISVIVGIALYHSSVYNLVNVMFLVSTLGLVLSFIIHFYLRHTEKKVWKKEEESIFAHITSDKKLPVSICLPAYNEEKNIGNLLKALLKQKTNLIEIKKIIVVSSACTDNTDKIVREFMSKDSRINLILEEKRNGKASAINKFLKVAKHPVVVVQSTDTIPTENTIEFLCRPFIADERIGMTGGAPVPVNDRGTFLGYLIHTWWWFHRNIPRYGEIIAFRNILDQISETTAVDEAYIQAHFIKYGFSVIHIDEAVVYNKGAENFKDLLKQRRRIFNGHARLQKAEGIRINAITRSALWLFLFKYEIESIKHLFWLSLGLVIEIYARFLGIWDTGVKNINPFVWDTATSTKNLNIKKQLSK